MGAHEHTGRKSDSLYAVAFRDGADLFLFQIIRRRGIEVYVIAPRDDPEHNPHSSCHASGQTHHKSYNHILDERQGPKPDANFRGTRTLGAWVIGPGTARNINKPCDPAKFKEVIEIQLRELRPEMELGRTRVSVDLVEPNRKPNFYMGETILREWVFKDSVPWILVTLYDSSISSRMSNSLLSC